jgi:hypothetical protein
MGCPKEVVLGDYLTFSVVIHNPRTGVASDADSLPTYRIYEDETETHIFSGTMPKFDDANTTGFYLKRVECSAANGCEVGKSYTICVQAVVGGISGTDYYGFTVSNAPATVWGHSAITLT